MKTLGVKWLVVAVSVMLLLVPAVSGCTAANTTTADIVAKSQTAGASVTFYQFDANLNLTLATTGSNPSDNINLSITGNGKGALDNPNKVSHILFNISADVPKTGNMNIPIDYYSVGGWMYVKAGIPLLGDKWSKVQIQDSQWESQDQIAQQLGFLKSAIQVDQAGTENVGNMVCYVLVVKPDLTKIAGWFTSLGKDLSLEGQQFTLPAPTSSTVDISRFIRQLSIKEWVAKDSYLITKAEIVIDVSIDSAVFKMPIDSIAPSGESGLDQTAQPTTAGSSGQLTMTLSATVTYHDYNQPIAITLPTEAQNAKEFKSAGN